MEDLGERGIFSDNFIAHFLLCVPAKEFLNIGQHFKVGECCFYSSSSRSSSPELVCCVCGR